MDSNLTQSALANELFTSIQTGLKLDPFNYKFYEMLGTYYRLKGNDKQAYISYIQAKFYCSVENEKLTIQTTIDELKANGSSVPKIAIIILSWNLKDMTAQCINSIRQTTPEELREIIVVDNASTDGSAKWIQEQSDITYQLNNENHYTDDTK